MSGKMNIFEGAKSALNRFGFAVKKNSPAILMGVGIAGAVGGTVMACIATTKVSKVLKNRKEQLDAVETVLNDENKTEEYSEEDAKKDRMIINVQSAAKIMLIFAPAAAVEFGSVVCVLASHGIMKKRNAALAAAYAAVDTGFKKYRARVADKFGKEAELDLAHDIIRDLKLDSETDPETGEKISVEGKKVSPGLGGSPYAMIFSADTAKAWEKDHDYNMMCLRAEQQYATDRLRARGYLYLNEVYERLGVEGTKMGQIVGWVYDPENPDYDNFVDFGIREYKDADGDEEIVLDFNVQGNILDLM